MLRDSKEILSIFDKHLHYINIKKFHEEVVSFGPEYC